MSLELLTTKIIGMKDAILDFPRTLGFANLNYNKLDGYLLAYRLRLVREGTI